MTTEYKTLRVPVEAWHDAHQAKKDNETWGEYLQRCSENPPTTTEYVDAAALDLDGRSDGPVELDATDVDRIARAIVERLR